MRFGLFIGLQNPGTLSISVKAGASLQVVSLHVNPLDCNLVISAGNDHTARICDLRALSGSDAQAGSVPGELIVESCLICGLLRWPNGCRVQVGCTTESTL